MLLLLLLLLLMMMMMMMMVQNNAIDILTKCDELRKQFMPLRWEVSLRGMSFMTVAAYPIYISRKNL